MDSCGACKKSLKGRGEVMACDDCDKWIHYKCSGMSRSEFEIFSDKTADHLWFCSSCRPYVRTKIMKLVKRDVERKLEIERLRALVKTLELEKDAIAIKEVRPKIDSKDVGINTNFGTGMSWEKVKPSKKKSKRFIREVSSLPLANRFSHLKIDEEECGTILIGDSIIKRQDVEFVHKNPKYRKRRCFPGAKINDIIEICSEEIESTGTNTVHMVSIGGNDIKTKRADILLANFKDLIELYKNNRKNLKVIEILPRVGETKNYQSQAQQVNKSLKALCLEEEIPFIETWDFFAKRNDLFGRDGIHLSYRGNMELGKIINKAAGHNSGNL